MRVTLYSIFSAFYAVPLACAQPGIAPSACPEFPVSGPVSFKKYTMVLICTYSKNQTKSINLSANLDHLCLPHLVYHCQSRTRHRHYSHRINPPHRRTLRPHPRLPQLRHPPPHLHTQRHSKLLRPHRPPHRRGFHNQYTHL
jgi:hypothetical protein